MCKTVLLLTVAVFSLSCHANAGTSHNLYIGRFSQGIIANWKVKEFAGQTEYKIVNDTALGNRLVLKATSNRSASGLFVEGHIDLQQTPYLHWSWKTDKLYSNLDESKKQGDDYVARLYIVIDGGLFFWQTRALNYVWSSSFKQGQVWANPFTANATMFAIESGNKKLGKWIYYSRNVGQDLKTLVGKTVRYIDGVAVMTDSDNGGQQATTYYGDIYFSQTP
ncbi:MAG: DUF3047 domain-containing protein [Psychromonas sp.]|nr:DUF3047 domain-containing protein [Psychromonas sp.]